ncbi:MAG: hypothetical protein NW206_19795 [Hyphomonadaceae bacterium]|nr:hypothetical protein [Hyphomonadaceae bacterium]
MATAKKPAAQKTSEGKSATRDKQREAMQAAVEGGDADEIIETARIDADNIIGELTDAFIAEEKAAKHRPEWEKLTEEQQRERIDAANERARSFVAGVVAALFERGGVASVECNIAKVDFVPGEETAKVNCVIVQSPETLEHFNKGMRRAKFVFADTGQFDGPVMTQAQPTQNALALETPDEEIDAETGEVKAAAL